MRLDDSDRVPLIVATVCETLGTDVDDVYRHDKHAGPSLTRHIAWACTWMLTAMTPTAIAASFDRSPKGVSEGISRFTNRDGSRVSIEAHRSFLLAMEACEKAIAETEAKMTEAVK